VGWLIGAGAAALSIHLIYPTEVTSNGSFVTTTTSAPTAGPAAGPTNSSPPSQAGAAQHSRSRMVTVKASALEALAYGDPSATSMLVVLMTDTTLLESKIDHYRDRTTSDDVQGALMTV
jgi:hypothetical protein